MRKWLVFILMLLLFKFPVDVDAHLVGQPPFFKINGEYSELYPVPISSATNFDLPQDLAKQNHLVGESLQMEMDVNQLPILPEVIDNTVFEWEMGDGGVVKGLKNTYSFSKPGSYVMKVMATYKQDEPQLIQSTLINILPNKDFQLPQSKIVVNGQESKDPLIDIIKVDFKKPIRFDSSKSWAKEEIVGYEWDFGDGKTSTEANPTYTYDPETIQMFPVLRVKDSNGFIHDSYVQLDAQEDQSLIPAVSSQDLKWWPLVIGVALLGGVGAWFLMRKK